MAVDLLELAERCEAAEGPDRELDAEIALALGIVRERDGALFYGHRDYSVMVLERGYYDIEGSAPELPHLTASIDAAIRLVPDGYTWTLYADGCAGVCPKLDEDDIADGTIWAASTALALCAAALRARKERGE